MHSTNANPTLDNRQVYDAATTKVMARMAPIRGLLDEFPAV